MFAEVIDKIKKAKRIGIFNHINPDGDALGSAFALKLCLVALGKEAQVFLRDGDALAKEYKLLKDIEGPPFTVDDCDLKIAVDCADKERLGEFADCFDGETVAIDHHMTHREFAKTTVVVPSAPATGEIIFDLINALGVKIDADIAYNIYLAITCDTGSFRFSSTTAKTHIVAAKLVETGIDFAAMSKSIFDTKSFDVLKMYKMGIERLELYKDGKIALLCFSEADFKSVGVSEAETDSIVTLPNSVSGAEVGVYIRQRGDAFKVSLRSNGRLNVADIALYFGGGGHKMASGFTLNLPVEETKKVVVEKLSSAIDGE